MNEEQEFTTEIKYNVSNVKTFCPPIDDFLNSHFFPFELLEGNNAVKSAMKNAIDAINKYILCYDLGYLGTVGAPRNEDEQNKYAEYETTVRNFVYDMTSKLLHKDKEGAEKLHCDLLKYYEQIRKEKNKNVNE